MTKHKFLVASTLFDVTFDEQFKALKFVAKEDVRVDTSVKTGVISVSEHNYVFMHPIANSPLITAPVDSGYTGDITIISSRPITLPKGYTFFYINFCVVIRSFNIIDNRSKFFINKTKSISYTRNI